MTRSSTEVWNEIKNSPLNTGITTGEVRLNYWDGRDVFEGEYVSADYVTVDAADISETQIHFKENGHYGSSHLILGGKYLLDTEKHTPTPAASDTDNYTTPAPYSTRAATSPPTPDERS